MTRHQVMIAALLVVLGGCASTPDLDYFTIDFDRSGTATARPDLRVDRFVVSERLDRRELVIRSSPVRVEHYAAARWASGIGEMVQAKLAAELGPTAADPTMRVGGRVTSFEQVDTTAGPRARVAIDVRIRSVEAVPGDPPLLAGTYRAERLADGDGAEAVVLALSRALESIAAEIAADAAGLTTGG